MGFLLIAFAVAMLISWMTDDWWLLIPVFMLEAGVFYVIVGTLSRSKDPGAAREQRESFYYVFWGGTLGLLGVIWLLNRQYPDNVPLLIIIFILWLGGIVVALSLPRLRGGKQTTVR
jgi:apolipoprotein N-acyltransferase